MKISNSIDQQNSSMSNAAYFWSNRRLNRNAAFLEKATNFESNKERLKIYDAYFKLPGTSTSNPREASRLFDGHMASAPELRRTCEKQIALFNELGLVYRRRWWILRDPLVELLPHAAIYIWVFCRSHIIRRRQNVGKWFATPFLKFTLESVKFVLKFDGGLCLRSDENPESKELRISVADLKSIRDELKKELRGNKDTLIERLGRRLKQA